MQKFSFKIAFSIIIAGLFIVVAFTALSYENLTPEFYIVTCFVVIFIFLFGFAMGGIYAMPVKGLLRNVVNIGSGNIKEKVQVKTKDEIEELSNVFNKVTEGLQKSNQEMEILKKTSDIKFKTKDIVSEKVIDALEAKIRSRTSDLERVVAERDQLKQQLQDLQSQVSRKKK